MLHNSANTKLRQLLQGALFIAIAVVLQALRLVLPLPLVASTFIIGTLVNMMLALTAGLNGLRAALLLCVVLPAFAYAQGQLALPLLIPVVALGNLVFVLLVVRYSQGAKIAVAPLGKALAMGLGAYTALAFAGLQSTPSFKPILYAMTLPQFITGLAGIILAKEIEQRIAKYISK